MAQTLSRLSSKPNYFYFCKFFKHCRQRDNEFFWHGIFVMTPRNAKTVDLIDLIKRPPDDFLNSRERNFFRQRGRHFFGPRVAFETDFSENLPRKNNKNFICLKNSFRATPFAGIAENNQRFRQQFLIKWEEGGGRVQERRKRREIKKALHKGSGPRKEKVKKER